MAWDILKWILLVLAAGFVGYFGRHLAMVLIRRMTGAEGADSGVAAQGREDPGPDAKIEKKRIKQQLKLEKKRGADPEKRERS